MVGYAAADQNGLPKRNRAAKAKAVARREPSKTPDIRVPGLDEFENGNNEELDAEDEEEIPTEDDDENDDDFKAPAKPGAGRGGKQGAGKTAAASRKGKGRAKNQDNADANDEDGDVERPIAGGKTKDDFEVANDNKLFSAFLAFRK